MEGIFFYWLAWLGWVWVTFFIGKMNSVRVKIAAWLLVIIIAASFSFELFVFDLNLSGVILTLFLFFETNNKKVVSFLYFYSVSFVVMLAYTSFLMFELLDPVWVLFDRRILIAAMGVILVSWFTKNSYERALIIISGFLQGEIIYSIILWKFQFPYVISSPGFLDTLAVTLTILFVWSAVTDLITTISSSSINHAEGEEHKTP